jgi:hypothetical protein
MNIPTLEYCAILQLFFNILVTVEFFFQHSSVNTLSAETLVLIHASAQQPDFLQKSHIPVDPENL